MIVALIQFKKTGKRYYFDLNNLELEVGDKVVVETIRGVEVGYLTAFKDITKEDLVTELKPIVRLATEKDLKDHAENLSLVPEIIETTKDLVKKNKLDMSVLDAKYTLDRKRLLIYFEADHRVDFRNLVKDLSAVYQTRIELRQIGSRDGAKLVGGIGPCGLILCCNTFIGEFETITIKMAKSQNISLNPNKISGVCDKLLCCIKYEEEVYKYLKEKMPDIGDNIKYENKQYEVKDVNLLKEKVKIKYGEEDSHIWLELEEIERVDK